MYYLIYRLHVWQFKHTKITSLYDALQFVELA